MSSYAISVILVPKKKKTWRMCIDCHAINNIMVRYKHQILILNDILYEYGYCMFSKIDLKSEYHQIKIK